MSIVLPTVYLVILRAAYNVSQITSYPLDNAVYAKWAPTYFKTFVFNVLRDVKCVLVQTHASHVNTTTNFNRTMLVGNAH